MPIYTYISETEEQLSDNTPVRVITYAEQEFPESNPVTKFESQVVETDTASQNYDMALCWQVTNPSNLALVDVADYKLQNTSGQFCIPKPKGQNNPGGSPIKY